MAGEAFGLGARDVDLLADRPRRCCGGCGGALLWDQDALGIFAASDITPEDRAGLAEMWRLGGSVYGCTVCGLLGWFSPPWFS